MSEAVREEVRRRDAFRCGYFGISDERYLRLQARLDAMESQMRHLTENIVRLTGGIDASPDATP